MTGHYFPESPIQLVATFFQRGSVLEGGLVDF
jgi:hypothetical protein